MVWSAQPQSASLLFCLVSEEACLYVGADWLSSSVSQSVVRGQLIPFG